MRIIFRGLYAAFPAAALHTGNLAYATDLLVLFQSNGAAWVGYSDYPDYQGEKAGLYPQPEWAAKEGTDKNIYAYGTNKDFGDYITGSYTVPTGKTLFITGFSFIIGAETPTDYDHFLYAWGDIKNFTTGVIKVRLGGVGGGSCTFPKPITFSAGEKVEFWVWNISNITCALGVTAWGYEA